VGAGLGGGSSNSATTLLVLNSLWNCGLSLNKLSDLGQTLGADIPVFIKGNTSFAESTGEILSPLSLPKKWFLVITPSCSISTQEIFHILN
jgi:4-diphosphocytidyl-2-C-methyl-D-erythritol kinase